MSLADLGMGAARPHNLAVRAGLGSALRLRVTGLKLQPQSDLKHNTSDRSEEKFADFQIYART